MTPALPQGSCVLVLNAQGMPLVVNRPTDLQRFCLPGGKLEPGENFLEAAVRETREETGVCLDPAVLQPVFRGQCPGDGDRPWYDVVLFVALSPLEHIPGSEEADLVARFGTYGDLLDLSPFKAYNRAGLCLALGAFSPEQSPSESHAFFSQARAVLTQALGNNRG